MNAVLSRPHARFPRLSRLGWLMGLYGENHAKIARLFDVRALARGHYVSMAGDGLELHIEVIEQHRYTTELRLSYAMLDPVTGEPDPSAYVRVYHDARQLEVTHCYVGRRWQDVIGMFKWFFGKGPKPIFDRWTYWEKFDYMAVFWGMFIIGGSGLLLNAIALAICLRVDMENRQLMRGGRA